MNFFRSLIITGALSCNAQTLPAQTLTQSVSLRAGWNAVFLEVTPDANSVEAVFQPLTVAGVLESVWRRRSETSSVQFVQDPAQLLPEAEDWLTWFPSAGNRGVLRSLHVVHGGHSLLIKLASSAAPQTLTLTGRPVIQPHVWQKGRNSLSGFYVSPSSPPTFASFFTGSAAHATSGVRKMDAVTGNWVPITVNETIARGQAYMVFSSDFSTFQGPTSVEVDDRGLLDFSEFLVERPITLRNSRNAGATFNLKVLGEGGAGKAGGVALSVYNDWSGTQDTNGDGAADLPGWVPLSGTVSSIPVGLNTTRTVRVGIRRQDMAGQGRQLSFASLLEITSALGTSHQIGVHADGMPAPGDPSRNAGLWVGHAVVDRVQQVTQAATSTPQSVSSEARLRMIVHVDLAGQARLLREAIVMWIDGLSDESGTITEAGRFIVFADGPAIATWKTQNTGLAPRLKGLSEKAGKLGGQRMSSAGFSFVGSRIFSGAQAFGNGAATVTIQALPDGADGLNPFRHRYHPDHAEGLDYSRTITLAMALSSNGQPETVLRGSYAESISGLHRSPIAVSGSFSLSRALGPVTFIP
jgi:hypothetical protein